MNPQPPITPLLFDRALHRRFQSRAHMHWLGEEAAHRAAERLMDTTRHFERTLLIGAQGGLAAPILRASGRIGRLHVADLVSRHTGLALDLERLPIAEHSLDAAILLGGLHWTNDPVGALIQLRLALKPDGMLLAIVPGAQTLRELRDVLLTLGAEEGLAPRLSPLLEVRDGGNLLQRCGFALPVADSESLTASYAAPQDLFHELRAMGEGNALTQRTRRPGTRDYWARVATFYESNYADAEQRIPATFEFVTLTGWKPHESQPKAAKRGSGAVNLGTVFRA